MPERLKFDIQIAGEVDSKDLPKTVVVGGSLKAETIVKEKVIMKGGEEGEENNACSETESSLEEDGRRRNGAEEEEEEEEDDYYGMEGSGSSSTSMRPMTPADMRALRNRGAGNRAKKIWFQRFCCM